MAYEFFLRWFGTRASMVQIHSPGHYRLVGLRFLVRIRLMEAAMKSTGSRTKSATVDAALRVLNQTRVQTSIQKLRGKVEWEGDLQISRLGRTAG
jgi:hypothetical protein